MADEMFTTRQAALYMGVTEADMKLAISEGKVRAWSMPFERGFLLRKSDLMRFRMGASKGDMSRQLQLFTADSRRAGVGAAATSADADREVA